MTNDPFNQTNPDQKSDLTVSRTELLRDGSDAQFRELVHTLLAFSARLESVRQEFGSHIGLSGVQYTILVSIAHLQGEMSLEDAAERATIATRQFAKRQRTWFRARMKAWHRHDPTA